MYGDEDAYTSSKNNYYPNKISEGAGEGSKLNLSDVVQIEKAMKRKKSKHYTI